MNAAHAVFSGLGRLNSEEGRLFYISRADVEAQRQKFVRRYLAWLPEPWRGKLSELFAHAMLAAKVWKAPSNRTVVVLEFFASYGLFFYPLMLAYPRPFFIFFMWDQEFARQGGYRLFALRLFRWFLRVSRGHAVQLEVGDDCLPRKLRLPRQKTAVVPMPALEGMTLRRAIAAGVFPTPLRLGVVGMPRRDKKHLGDDFLHCLRACRDLLQSHGIEVRLVLGVPLRRENTEGALKHSEDFEIVDTSERGAYEQCLESLDILVCAFDEHGYYYRSSGVICEAASYGVWVVCPDYPVLRHQVAWPAPVGEVYGDALQLPEAVLKTAQMMAAQGNKPHEEWRRVRTPELVDGMLQKHLVGRGRTRCAA